MSNGLNCVASAYRVSCVIWPEIERVSCIMHGVPSLAGDNRASCIVHQVSGIWLTGSSPE